MTMSGIVFWDTYFMLVADSRFNYHMLIQMRIDGW